MSTRYSMRLRQQGGSANDAQDNADNEALSAAAAADPAAAAAASRRALGNISNREGNSDDSDNNAQKTKKTKPSGSIVERVRSRARAAKAAAAAAKAEPKQAVEEKKPAARRTSSRRAAAVAAEEIKATTSKKATKVAAAAAAAAKKEPKTKKTTAAKTKKETAAAKTKKETKPKRGGGTKKRSSSEGPRGRTSKRAKKSTTALVTNEQPKQAQRASRSRSRSTTSSRRKSSRKSAVVVATPMRPVDPVEILPPGEDRLVPQDFGLTRTSFGESDSSNFTYGIAHYDAADRMDPLRCKDYVTDMFQHYYHAETDTHPKPYMHEQEDINEKMRAILIDWLVEVHMKFRLVPETLYLCVNIIDRYCSIEDVARNKLQLVGVTALLLACKHEEIYPPEVRDCVYITDRAYDRQDVLDMEQTILRVLNWKISLPTAYPFLDRFLSLTNASEMTRHAATYYLERTLQEHDLLEYRPSMVCASAVILALNNPDIRIHEDDYERELPGLPKVLMEYTGFDKSELWECMELVSRKICEPAICASRRHLTAVKKKYEHRKYLSVSSALEMPSVLFVKNHTAVPEE